MTRGVIGSVSGRFGTLTSGALNFLIGCAFGTIAFLIFTISSSSRRFCAAPTCNTVYIYDIYNQYRSMTIMKQQNPYQLLETFVQSLFLFHVIVEGSSFLRSKFSMQIERLCDEMLLRQYWLERRPPQDLEYQYCIKTVSQNYFLYI